MTKKEEIESELKMLLYSLNVESSSNIILNN